MRIHIEAWNSVEIRFVEVNKDDWQAISKDVCEALSIKNSRSALASIPSSQKGVATIDTLGGKQTVSTVKEVAIYKLIFKSRKKEAVEFQEWIYDTIKMLRTASGIEGFQIFRMLDKDHQRETMGRLRRTLMEPGRPDFIKANVIANKAVSTAFGHPKMLKKEQMTPDMIVKRQAVLEDTVDLMSLADRFDLKISVSEAIYSKYAH